MNYGVARSTNAVIYAPAAAQTEFVRKVYSLFFLSILVTVGIGAFCYQPAVAATLAPLFPVLIIGQFILVLVLSFSRRAAGLNTILFYLFSAIWGALSGPALAQINAQTPGLPMQAALLTTAVFGGLTLYVFQSGKDFSFLGGMLFMGIIALLLTGLLMFFLHIAALYMLYCVAGVLLFSGFVLYDTSNIMRNLAPGEEVTGAINLYLDLLNMFWLILELLGIFSRRD